MAYEATGTVKTVGDTAQVTERFSKRAIVLSIADNPKYPQTVEFEANGDRCALLDGVNVGDEVRIEFGLRGREWKSPKGEVKTFNTLAIWKVDIVKSAGTSQHTTRHASDGGYSGPPSAGPEDDLPF